MLPSIDIRERVAYGVSREPIMLGQLRILFDSEICKALFKRSFFDLHNPFSYHFIELKSLRYSFDKYSTCIMNLTKTVYSRMLFVWEYLEDDGSRDLYFHFFDSTKLYNTRDINKYNNLEVRDVIDVEKCDVEKFDFNNTYSFINDSTDEERRQYDAYIALDFKKSRYY